MISKNFKNENKKERMGNMRKFKLKKIISYLLTLLLSLNLVAPYVRAFCSETHEYTTKMGMNLFRNNFQESFDRIYNEKSQEQLMTFCTRPDEDESTGGFKYHFYNPATEKNFMGEDESALKKCNDHYNNALKYYKDGKQLDAFEELGRSLHFLEDLNTPVHTNNQTFIDTAFNVAFHVSFENRCKEIQDDAVALMCKREFVYYKDNSLTTIAKASALLANDNFYALYEKFIDKNTVAAHSIINAQKAVAGVLYKFTLDVA